MRLLVLGLSVWLLGCEPAPQSTPTTSRDLSWLDARSAQQALAAGEVSSEQLVQFYLQQIASHNQQGHQLYAITDLNPEALAQAKALDQERAAGKIRSPLHGLPAIVELTDIALHEAEVCPLRRCRQRADLVEVALVACREVVKADHALVEL